MVSHVDVVGFAVEAKGESNRRVGRGVEDGSLSGVQVCPGAASNHSEEVSVDRVRNVPKSIVIRDVGKQVGHGRGRERKVVARLTET
jgi:hypothetical protein